MLKLTEKNMKIPVTSNALFLVLLLLVISLTAETQAAYITCYKHSSPCFLTKAKCPKQCDSIEPTSQNDKVCAIDCDKPECNAECRKQKPNCEGPGSACQDPRFIGGDGTVFYFHGSRNEHFTLVSDLNLQINARFIGLRPAGRPRDYTWIQALGILFDSHSFTVEAIKTATWDEEDEHLSLSYDGMEIEGYAWESAGSLTRVDRAAKNTAIITIPEIAEITVNVVPVTKEDDRIHKYQIPSDDSFAHLEVQFRFFGLSPKVEGVLGRTYQPDFVSPAKPGVAMPVVGGEDKYRTASLLSTECKYCVFSRPSAGAITNGEELDSLVMSHGSLDCKSGGNGIVCRK